MLFALGRPANLRNPEVLTREMRGVSVGPYNLSLGRPCFFLFFNFLITILSIYIHIPIRLNVYSPRFPCECLITANKRRRLD